MLHLRKPAVCLTISLAVHVVCLYAFGMFGRLDFGAPVALPVVSVDLHDPSPLHAPISNHEKEDDEPTAPSEAPAASAADHGAPPEVGEVRSDAPAPAEPAQADAGPTGASHEPAQPSASSMPTETPPRRHSPTFELLEPLRRSGEFLVSESEKLSYRIYLLGMPVGSARLEARRDKGEVRISLRVTSDAVISNFYPVDDLIEARHINGNFIISTIRQKEGSFVGDRGFTIFLRERNVFWIDRLTRKSLRESVPTSEVVDLLSGLYYLRNRQLEVGSSETLHIYDSDSYAEVPVEVMRRETVRLSGFREVESLLVKPQLKTGGIFRRTGDIRIWLSDDEFRVPVKVETTIPLGRVTAELVDAESQP